MEFKVNVKVTEVYTESFIVEASNKEEAESKMKKAWNEDLYETTTDCVDQQIIDYSCEGKATQKDIAECNSLDDYIEEDEEYL